VVRAVNLQAMPRKRKIVIAEDDFFLIWYIQTLISRWDCELAIEPTAEGAIQGAATFRPDVALLGFVTPGMDGAQAGIELLKVSPGTQIVLFNESVPADILSDLRARGFNFRTLSAPFYEEELRDVCFPQARRNTHIDG
jgi:DNA-binding NarL/FixJ family response regulator